MEIDIILPTHNHLELTINCVKALYEWTQLPFKLTVIDDSTDLTPEWFKLFQLDHDNINYLHFDDPKFLAGGSQIINIGLKNTKNEFIVNLNNSIEVEPLWLNAALDQMEGDPQIGVMGFKLLSRNGLISHAGLQVANGVLYNIGKTEPAHRYTFMCEVPAVGWALALFRRSAFPDGVDEDYYIGFRGWDDVDWCYDLRKRGYKVMYCGFGAAYHNEGATRITRTEEFYNDAKENIRRFFARWGEE